MLGVTKRTDWSDLDVPETPDPGLHVAPLGALQLPQLGVGHPTEVGGRLGRRDGERQEGREHEGRPATSSSTYSPSTSSSSGASSRLGRVKGERQSSASGQQVEHVWHGLQGRLWNTSTSSIWSDWRWDCSCGSCDCCSSRWRWWRLGLVGRGLLLLLVVSLGLHGLQLVPQSRHLLLENLLLLLRLSSRLLLLLLLWLLPSGSCQIDS